MIPLFILTSKMLNTNSKTGYLIGKLATAKQQIGKPRTKKRASRLEISSNHGTVETSGKAEASSAEAYQCEKSSDASTRRFAWVGEQSMA